MLVRDHLAFTSAVDALAADALERGPVAGLSIAVFERGLPVLAKGHGFTDVGAQTPATPQTSCPIASVSRRFTALMMRPGLRHSEASQLIDTGGGAFVVADDPSLELRFLVRDDQPRGYARYRNGWFAALAVRSVPSAAPRPAAGRN